MTENALRLDWADFEPEDDLHAVGLALLVAGIVVDTDEAGNELPGDLVRLDLRTAEIVLDALRSSGRTLAFHGLTLGPEDHGHTGRTWCDPCVSHGVMLEQGMCRDAARTPATPDALHGESRRGDLVPIDLDAIEMRWASQWNESDDGEVRAWRDDVAALIDEVRRLRHVSNGYYEAMVARTPGSTPATPDALREAHCAGCVGYTVDADPLPSGEPGEPYQVQCPGVPAPTLDAHPGEPHEFRTVCQRCGENGYLHVAVITDLEVVKVEDRAALATDSGTPEP